jgi:hypothetical protein
MKGRERERGKGRRKGESGRKKNRRVPGEPKDQENSDRKKIILFRNDFSKNLNGKKIIIFEKSKFL